MASRGTDAPAASQRTARGTDFRRGPRIALALAIGVAAVAPLWRLLDRADTGLAGAATVAMTESLAGMVWAGLALLAIPGILAARAVDPSVFERGARRLASLLEAPSTVAFAAFIAFIAFAASAAFGHSALAGQPNLVDAMSQLLHARVLAGGSIAGPDAAFGEFWMPQQSVFTEHGWVSQYPPGHVFLLSLGLRAGMVQLVGPLMLAATVFFTALAAERLLPDRIAVARAGALLAAVSPFMIAQAGSYMNHATAAAFGAMAVWCAARSASARGAVWAIGAGLGLGAMFTTRPLSALTLAAVITAWLAVPLLRSGSGGSRLAAARVLGILLGALPFGLLVAWYNAHFFGSPATFGYTAALGPSGGPGFGIDPWGNTYGLAAAVGYTSAELTALSLHLLETPLPLVALIALWLALVPATGRGERLIVGWATAPVFAQLLYWHHGLFMGPRMLMESSPAWLLLTAIAVPWLIMRLPATSASFGAYSPRSFAAAATVAAGLAGLLYLAPARLSSHAQRPAAPDVALAAGANSLVFVHGGWTSRLSARLAASGMRLDSVETALRQNPTCAVQAWVDARAAGGPVPTLDFEKRAVRLPESVEISPGNRIRVSPGERLGGECARQAAADRFGTIDVTPLLWLGELPGVEGGIVLARDMGPEANRRLLRSSPDRRAWLLVPAAGDGKPELQEYEAAIRGLWGDTEGT